MLIVPGVLVLALLFWLRYRVPDPLVYEEPEQISTTMQDDAAPQVAAATVRARTRLPARFWLYAAATAVLSADVASFPLLAYHAQTTGLLTDAQVPLLFAAAMLVDGASGLVMGRVYDRFGARTLLLVPVAAATSAIAFTDSAALIWAGVVIWGVVNGILDSTVKAVVTELVPSISRAIAFGWLSFLRGAGLLLAGAGLGFAYDQGFAALLAVILIANAAGLTGLSAPPRSTDVSPRTRCGSP